MHRYQIKTTIAMKKLRQKFTAQTGTYWYKEPSDPYIHFLERQVSRERIRNLVTGFCYIGALWAMLLGSLAATAALVTVGCWIVLWWRG